MAIGTKGGGMRRIGCEGGGGGNYGFPISPLTPTYIAQPPFQFLRSKVHMKLRYTRFYFDGKSLYIRANCNIAHLKQKKQKNLQWILLNRPLVSRDMQREKGEWKKSVLLKKEEERFSSADEKKRGIHISFFRMAEDEVHFSFFCARGDSQFNKFSGFMNEL